MQRTSLITDLYELTMAQVYLEEGKTGNAVFSLFVRKLPPNRNFLVACGLETLINFIEDFKFGDKELKYLKGLKIFKPSFLDYLKEYRFEGSIYAVPEGTIVFQNEPIVQVEASLPDAQILETLVINLIHLETLIASKAARCYLSAKGKILVDFGLRRAHSPQAGIYGARACYIAGFNGTSNLEAGKRFNIPVYGTMAHSFVMVFDDEEEAFRAFYRHYPDRTLLLVDTYDTVEGVKKAIKLLKEGKKIVGVRIDSGDIANLAFKARELFDSEGFNHVKILVSGGVDEYDIHTWLGQDCPIDAFGVGTKLLTSSDSPYLDIAYKLVEYEGKPKFKTSPGKATFPYKRQIIRYYKDGIMDYDEVIKYQEEGLVEKVIQGGTLTKKLPSLNEIRNRFIHQLESLPNLLKSLEKKQEYDVRVMQ